VPGPLRCRKPSCRTKAPIHAFNNLLTSHRGFTDLLFAMLAGRADHSYLKYNFRACLPAALVISSLSFDERRRQSDKLWPCLNRCRARRVSVVLPGASFPRSGHPAFGLIALAPLLVAIVHVPLRRSSCSAPRRLRHSPAPCTDHAVMAVYGDFRPGSPGVTPVESRIWRCFPRWFALISTRRIMMRHGRRGAALSAARVGDTELGRTYIFTGFPWWQLGLSPASVLPIDAVRERLRRPTVAMLVRRQRDAGAVGTGSAPAKVPYNRRCSYVGPRL